MTIGLIKQEMAARALKFGAVGIGEDHTKPDGRNLAIHLIERGAVKRLFVELSPGKYQGMIDGAANHGSTLQGSDATANTSSIMKCLGFHVNFSCDVRLEKVVAIAIAHGVPVHCVDHRIANHPIRGGTPKSMDVRNDEIVKGVREVTEVSSAREGGAAGSLLLFGGGHFDEKNSITSKFPDLQWIKAG